VNQIKIYREQREVFMRLKPGKLPINLLKKALASVSSSDSRVVLGPKVGEDAAIIDCGDRFLVIASDPITFTSENAGWYMAHVNANDLYVTGATPKWLMATLLLPVGTSENQVEKAFAQLQMACKEIEVSLIGGHTEVTEGVSRIIFSGTMIGEVEKEKVVFSSGASIGDSIVLTRGIAIEGTAILAHEAEQDIIARGGSVETISRAKRLVKNPGISVKKDSQIALSGFGANCMHDPTEGGLSSALAEIGLAASVGFQIDQSLIPVLPECKEITQALSIDPMGLISSGALMITLPPDQAKRLVIKYKDHGIDAFVIGKILPRSAGWKVKLNTGNTNNMVLFERDELARYFSENKPFS